MHSLIQICLRQKNYDLYLLIYWPIATIEKKFSKSRKNFHNREKTFRSRKKFWNPEKYFRVKKKWNREKNYGIQKKYFTIEENISKSRKKFQNRGKFFKIEDYFVTRMEKKSLELDIFTTFLHNSFIACVLLVTVKSCFAQNVALKLDIISVLHVGIKQGLG